MGGKDFCMSVFLRLPKVKEIMCMSRSTLYLRIQQGLMTPPVRLSIRCSVWPECEVTAINTARIADKSNDEIRELVRQLQQQRTAPTV